MNMYRELMGKALLGPVMEDLRSLRLQLINNKIVDGKLTLLDITNLWIFAGVDKTRLCKLWKDIYFQRYGFISRNCFSCWKIVCRFDRIVDLFKVEEFQKELNLIKPDRYVGKCGVETRTYCSWGGKYAAFWYAPLSKTNTLSEARNIAQEIQAGLIKINPKLKVKLKRGCTEMELRFGPSSKWIYEDEKHEFEDRLDNLFNIAQSNEDSEELNCMKRKLWLDQAFANGDQSLREIITYYPEDMGVIDTLDYLKEDITIQSKNVKRGKFNDSINWPSGGGKKQQTIFELPKIC